MGDARCITYFRVMHRASPFPFPFGAVILIAEAGITHGVAEVVGRVADARLDSVAATSHPRRNSNWA
ncbi:hypothetical protein AZG88_39905 [Rhodococcus sp. LB1]|nr:hypothetical protein AZG88_39905 [Rhodococcus sp. LB1]